MRRLIAFGAASITLLLGLTGCLPGPSSPTASPTPFHDTDAGSVPPADPVDDSVRFIRVIDGDTIETSEGRVRIIGIDTPERGVCGYEEASMAVGRFLFPGDPVTLARPEGQRDVDAYGRLLRYVITEHGTDIGLMQLVAGNAVARYDSTDGYPAHPKEAEYHAAQIATLSPDGSVLTPNCATLTPPRPGAEQAPSASTADTADDDPWWTQYSSCSRLKNNSGGHPKGPFNVNDPAEVEIYNWFQYGTGHSGDGDGDGLACE